MLKKSIKISYFKYFNSEYYTSCDNKGILLTVLFLLVTTLGRFVKSKESTSDKFSTSCTKSIDFQRTISLEI